MRLAPYTIWDGICGVDFLFRFANIYLFTRRSAKLGGTLDWIKVLRLALLEELHCVCN